MFLKDIKLLRSFSKKTDFRKIGDRARDIKNWPEAEKAYEAFLEGNPNDHKIWIQVGHSFKEQGKLARAENAYRRALAVQPEDDDAQLQLAHLLKRLNRDSEAAEIFSMLLSRSGLREAYTELTTLRQNGAIDNTEIDFTTESLGKNSVLIELDDLLGYLEAHKTLSGIQRVQVGVIQHVLSNSDQQKDEENIFVLNPINENCLWALKRSDLAEIIGCVTGPYVSHDRLKRLISSARANASAIAPIAGQTYLILGAFWGYGGVAGRYFHLKRAGVSIGAYIYDLIPITHTEYCDEGLPHEFALSFGDGLSVFDFILTISEYTAQEVRRYQSRLGMLPMPIQAVPLAHSNVDSAITRQITWGPNIAFLRDRPFVMMVSTIEARKNHTYLIAAWKQFIDEGLEPPDLVFVGRFGWRVSSLMEMLETSRYLDDRVHILHDLSDAELQTLYNACLFTVFPSFVEGWGLPVGESLAHGKPCVASSTSSIPEVGGDLVDYVDPHNLRDGINVLRRMMFDNEYRKERATKIKDSFEPRSWRDVGANLLEQVEQLRKNINVNRNPEPNFPAGTIFQPSKLALGQRLPKNYALNPTRLMLVASWYGIEALGCWMRGQEGALKFRTDLPPGTDIIVYLKLYAPDFLRGEYRISVTVGDKRRSKVSPMPKSDVRIRVGSSFPIRAFGVVEEGGMVSIELRVSGEVLPEANELGARRFAVGLGSVGYAACSDLSSRAEITESLMFDVLG